MRRDVVVIGASAGGVEALMQVMANLPADLPAAVLVVLHVPSYGGSVLPSILQRAGPLPALHVDRELPLKPGHIFVASPDHHLVLTDACAQVTRGPRENGHRPAVDVLFRTAARSRGPRVIAVVLSGAMGDGTAGLVAVKQRGGVTIVQDPEDALYPGMPSNALHNLEPDYVARAADIGGLVAELCQADLPDTEPDVPPLMEMEANLAMMNDTAMNAPDRPGEPSGFSCPDCAGTLFEIRDGELVRYRCLVGHAWSSEGLLAEQAAQLDGALWMALRSLEEKAALARQLGDRAQDRGSFGIADRFSDQANDATHAASLLRTLLQSGHPGLGVEPAPDEDAESA